MSTVVNNVIYLIPNSSIAGHQRAAAAGGQVLLSIAVLGGGADGPRADQGHLLHQAGGPAQPSLQVTPGQGESFK